MTLPLIENDTVVDADLHWNPLVNAINTNQTDIAAIDNRLADAIAVGGIDDLPAFKVEVDAFMANPPGGGALITNQADLQAALQVGGVVRVDGSVTITLTAEMQVTVAGTTITGGRFSRASGAMFTIFSDDVTIADAVFVGGGIGLAYDNTQKIIKAVGSSGNTLDRIVIRNCRFTQSRGDNIWLEWCTNSLVIGCVIDKYLYGGVMVLSGNGVNVVGNQISDAPLSAGVVNTYGIAFTDLLNTIPARSKNCQAVGNRLHLIDWEAIDTHGGENITVTGNTITACPRGIAFVVGNETRITAPIKCTASGNTIDGAGVRQTIREAIFLGGISGVPADGTVTGNTINNHTVVFATPFVDRPKTYVGQNSVAFVPWTAVDLTGSDYNANATYTPEYMVDGNTVYFRGMAVPKSSTLRTIVGQLNSAFAWPVILNFLGETHGSNASAGRGMLAVWGTDSATPGRLQMWYFTGTDTFSYPLFGAMHVA